MGTGNLIAIHEGPLSVSTGEIWSYDEKTGLLTRRDGTGKETWRLETSPINRPSTALQVLDFKEPFVVFSERERITYFDENIAYRHVLNIKENLWYFPMLNLSSWSENWYLPFAEAKCPNCPPLAISSKDDKYRMAIFSPDYTKLVYDVEFERKTLVSSVLLDIVRIGKKVYVLEGTNKNDISIVTIDYPESLDVPNEQLQLAGKRSIILPSELIHNSDDLKLSSLRVGHGWLLSDRQATRTTFWILDPVEGRLTHMAISDGVAPSRASYGDVKVVA
jgi:hypothetical protein